MNNLISRISAFNSEFRNNNILGFTFDMWMLYKANFLLGLVCFAAPLFMYWNSRIGMAITAIAIYYITFIVLRLTWTIKGAGNLLDAVKMVEESRGDVAKAVKREAAIFENYNFYIVSYKVLFLIALAAMYRLGI